MITLIATLGRSPGAVTGLYFDLVRSGLAPIIDEVYLLGTQDNDTQDAAYIVEERLKAYDNRIKVIPVPLDDREFRKAEAFQKIITQLLAAASARGAVHIGITGGQTGMGAMLAISAQIYSNVTLYHYWVHDNIGAHGTVQDLSTLKNSKNYERYELILNPGADRDKGYSQIIELPTLKIETSRESVEKTRTLAIRDQRTFNPHEANAILRLLPRRMTIEQALKYMELLEEIYSGADPVDKLDEIVEVLSAAGITNIRGHLIHLLRASEGDTHALQAWVSTIDPDKDYWAEGLQDTCKDFNYNAEVKLLRLTTRAALIGTTATFIQALVMLAQHFKL